MPVENLHEIKELSTICHRIITSSGLERPRERIAQWDLENGMRIPQNGIGIPLCGNPAPLVDIDPPIAPTGIGNRLANDCSPADRHRAEVRFGHREGKPPG